MRPYRHKVQYYETDQMGVVHHSNYIRWFEEARMDMLEQAGLSYAQMERQGIISPVLAVTADYLRMVSFGSSVTVRAFIREYNGIKLTMGYQVIDDRTQMVHCKGETKHCFLNRKGRPVSLKKECVKMHHIFMHIFKGSADTTSDQ